MDCTTFVLFVATETMLCLVPGPAVLLIVAQGMARGGRAALWANAGILIGNAIYFILSAAGLGTVLVASHDLFVAIKWIGAAYLVWLGVNAFFGRSRTLSVSGGDRQTSGPHMLANGIALQLANPKAILFFVALLPQFIDPTRPVVLQFAILAVASATIEFLVLALYGTLGGRVSRVIAGADAVKWINRVSGSLLITAGAALLVRRT